MNPFFRGLLFAIPLGLVLWGAMLAIIFWIVS